MLKRSKRGCLKEGPEGTFLCCATSLKATEVLSDGRPLPCMTLVWPYHEARYQLQCLPFSLGNLWTLAVVLSGVVLEYLKSQPKAGSEFQKFPQRYRGKVGDRVLVQWKFADWLKFYFVSWFFKFCVPGVFKCHLTFGMTLLSTDFFF